MNFLNLVRERYSVRKYLNKLVEREKIERCIEAARFAPSSSNTQPWRFIVVDDPELKNKIARETFGEFLHFNHFSLQAPVLIIIITERSSIPVRIAGIAKKRQFNLIDIGIAAMHICFQAVEEGLGTCILGWFNETKVKKLLNIPKRKRVDLIITMGYPDESLKKGPKKRKGIDNIRSYNSY